MLGRFSCDSNSMVLDLAYVCNIFALLVNALLVQIAVLASFGKPHCSRVLLQ